MKTIKEIRKEFNLTQKTLSEILKIPKRTIENWENGSRSCPDYVLDLIDFKLRNGGLKMLKFYMTETREYSGLDWFTDYEGYDKEKAVSAANDHWHHLTEREKEKCHVVVTEYTLDKPWDEYEEEEQLDFIRFKGNLIQDIKL